MSTSSSCDSEDEEQKRRLEIAVIDPKFLKTSSEPDAPASKMKMDDDGTVALDEFDKPYSLNVTPECQKFIAKQLSKSLEKNLKEVSPPLLSFETAHDVDIGIKLFATSQIHLTAKDLDETKQPRKQSRKHKVKKRRKKSKKETSHSTDSSSDSEREKLKSVAVSAEWVLQND